MKPSLVSVTFGRSKQRAEQHHVQAENAGEDAKQGSKMHRHMVLNASNARVEHNQESEGGY
jgi:hypothetical protein